MAQRFLEYVVKLRDQLTPEIRKISSEINRLGGQGQQAISRIALGAAGLYGVGQSVLQGLQPAIEMSNELGKIKGLGETAEGLELLERRALAFSTQWGESATEFVDASYDIKSAIDGLSAEELVGFTEISAVTGKATQTSGKIMTDYLGTMYSVLGAAKEADKVQWAERLMGQTAYTANKFKSDGAKIAQAFSTLGNQATLAGVKVNEQFAILGTLQNEMGGGESATKYSAFLSSIGTAGDKLGMNFRDANGMLKSTPEILEIIKKKYGDVIDDRESAELKKALGRKEGLDFIKALISKTDELGESITEIGKINGLDEVLEGASANVDVFKRLQAVIKGVQIAIGGQLLKVLNPFLQKFADVGSYIVDWLKVNKYVARLIGLLLAGVAALAAVGSAVTLLSGLFMLVKVGIAIFAALAAPVAILALKIAAVVGFIYLFRKQIAAFAGGLISTIKQANITLEPLKAAFSELFTRIGQIIARLTGGGDAWEGWATLGKIAGNYVVFTLNKAISALELIINVVTVLGDIWLDVFDGIKATWEEVCNAFTNDGWVAALWALLKGVWNMFENISKSIERGIFNMINTAIGWVNKLGLNIDPIELPVRLRAADINATTSASGIAGGAASFANNALKINGTNAASIAPPKGGKGIAGQVNQNRTAYVNNNIVINGADAAIQADNFVKAQERAQLGA